ncbi:hypothetical protein DFA_07193 [Cavenderia fasciculata]|uniref:NAD-dependent epimerase/dehydratase domain-containing protein n=1 Tax=Cavenderia fasciculata TaxID=261658 RepID=F4PVR2_CACFS|nr:uncharacterized protein DFA_07193 [Cavenderia fasciculata]EGG20076.1 hypothetical protein DFA_07193 [Cavenderia fasciculata]|eukprot:XP_004367059.1 hypothetical protein DFA_07193 [Cavenderia fasciculata]
MSNNNNSKEKINVLLTGATGYIGSNTLRPLIESGLYNVFVLVRKSSRVPPIFKTLASHPSMQIITSEFVDLKNQDQKGRISNLRYIIKSNRIKVIIHCAALMEFYPSDNKIVHLSNVVGTENLLKASFTKDDDESSSDESDSDSDSESDEEEEEDNRSSSSSSSPSSTSSSTSSSRKCLIDRFIYISSTEAMGGVTPTGQLRDEKSETHTDYYYGDTKVEAEALVKTYQTRYPTLDCIILRPTGVYGKDDDFVIYELMQAVSYGLLFFLPSLAKGAVMFTHIDDVVQGILLAIKRKKLATNTTSTYIICPDKGLEYREVLVFLNEKLNRMKPRLVFPAAIVLPIIDIAGRFMYLFKKKKFLYKKETLSKMAEDRLFSNEKAKKELGFKPTYSFKQGLNVTIEEYLENERLSYYPVSPLFIIVALFAMFVKFILWK